MKQTFRFIVKILVAAIVAACVALGVDALGIGYEYGFVTVFVCVAIGMALVLGAFDMKQRKESGYDSIRHYDGRRSYGQAAVFIGASCLFMGTPKECEDMTDDLWHRGVQAEFKMLTENDVEFNIL